MKNLYIDFDGVIIDTYKNFDLKSLKDYPKEKILDFFANFPWDDILKEENIIKDAINNIQKIIDSEKFNVSILSHINFLGEGVKKVEFIRKYFKDITVILCPKEISKTKMVHTEGAILVDDYSANLREWRVEDGIPVKFSLKEENDEFIVINSLDKIIDLF